MNVVNLESVQYLAKLFHAETYELYLVGGCVRDLLLNIEPHDIDFCTNATPAEAIALCNKYNLDYVNTGMRFGTITVKIHGQPFEITTYRSETNYINGRHPDDIFYESDIKKDLERRDLTINAIAIDPLTEKTVSLPEGIDDLKNRILRTPGVAATRIKEDPLRILRVLRFAIQFDFEIEDSLSCAIHENKNLLSIEKGLVSRERVTDEIKKMLNTRKPISKIFTEYRDVFAVLFPPFERCFDFKQNNRYHKHDVYEHLLAVTDNCKGAKFEIRLAALFHDVGKPTAYSIDEKGRGHFYGHPIISAEIVKEMFCKYLKLSLVEEKLIHDLVLYHDMSVFQTEKTTRRALIKYGEPFLRDWFVLKQADMDDHIFYNENQYPSSVKGAKDLLELVLAEQKVFKIKDLELNGKDVMRELHLAEGKEVGKYLSIIFDKVVDGKLENNKGALISYLKKLKQT